MIAVVISVTRPTGNTNCEKKSLDPIEAAARRLRSSPTVPASIPCYAARAGGNTTIRSFVAKYAPLAITVAAIPCENRISRKAVGLWSGGGATTAPESSVVAAQPVVSQPLHHGTSEIVLLCHKRDRQREIFRYLMLLRPRRLI